MKSRKNRVKDLIKPFCNGSTDELAEEIEIIYSKKKRGAFETDLMKMCKAFFIDYCERNDKDCYWTYQHTGNLDMLIKKLRHSIVKKREGEVTDTDVYNSFQVLLEHLPEFYKTQLQLKMITNNYDSLINQIRAGKKLSKQEEVTKANKEQFERIQKGQV